LLKDRLKTSAVLITITAILMWLDTTWSKPAGEGLWLMPLLLFFALGTAWDIASLLRDSGRSIHRPLVICGTAMITVSAAVPLFWPLAQATYPPDCPIGQLGWIVIAAIAAVFCSLLTEMRSYGRDESEDSRTIERTCGAVFVSLYVGLPMALLIGLRSMNSGNWGLAALVTLIAVTKSADGGAYFAGKLLGKHKLIPRLSPGKTWEGLFGGIATATIVAFVCLTWLFPDSTGGITASGLSKPIWGALVLGPVLTLAGLAGDLAESLVKRACGAKDSGNWLPGLGGVWDVTDSLIAAVMPAFLCFSAGIGGS